MGENHPVFDTNSTNLRLTNHNHNQTTTTRWARKGTPPPLNISHLSSPIPRKKTRDELTETHHNNQHPLTPENTTTTANDYLTEAKIADINAFLSHLKLHPDSSASSPLLPFASTPEFNYIGDSNFTSDPLLDYSERRESVPSLPISIKPHSQRNSSSFVDTGAPNGSIRRNSDYGSNSGGCGGGGGSGLWRKVHSAEDVGRNDDDARRRDPPRVEFWNNTAATTSKERNETTPPGLETTETKPADSHPALTRKPSAAKSFLLSMNMTTSSERLMAMSVPTATTHGPMLSPSATDAPVAWAPAHTRRASGQIPCSTQHSSSLSAQLARTRSWNSNSNPDRKRSRGSFGGSQYFPNSVANSAAGFTKTRTNSSEYMGSESGVSPVPQSPAISYLSMFSDHSNQASATTTTAQFDDEGQEIGSYVLGKILGRGMFSTVRQSFATRGETGEIVPYAVKIVKKTDDNGCGGGNGDDSLSSDDNNVVGGVNALEKEISIWRSLDHPHVVHFVEVVQHPQATFIFCDFCPGGNLLSYIRRNGSLGFAEEEACRMWRQLAQGALYLHEIKRVAHRDIKLENILMTERGDLKLGDFGFAEYLDRSVTSAVAANDPSSSSSTAAVAECSPATMGSIAYCAPEIVRPSKYDDVNDVKAYAVSASTRLPAGDCWALGVVLFALVTGILPFADDFEPRMILKIVETQYPWSPSFFCDSASASASASAPPPSASSSSVPPPPLSSSSASSSVAVTPTSATHPSNVNSNASANVFSPSSSSAASFFGPSRSASSQTIHNPHHSTDNNDADPSSTTTANNANNTNTNNNSNSDDVLSPLMMSTSSSFSQIPNNNNHNPRSRSSSIADRQADARFVGSQEVRELTAGLLTAHWRDRVGLRAALGADWIRKCGSSG